MFPPRRSVQVPGRRLTRPPTGLATQLALAYAIHKSFIFIRVPLTAWLTPRVAKWLRARGWKVGRKAS